MKMRPVFCILHRASGNEGWILILYHNQYGKIRGIITEMKCKNPVKMQDHPVNINHINEGLFAIHEG